MLTTIDSDRLLAPFALNGALTNTWRRVWLELAIPYFFVSYKNSRIAKPPYQLQTSLISRTQDLLDLCKAFKSEKSSFIDIQIVLVAPTWMTGKKGWELANLREIWTLESNLENEVGTGFVTDEGDWYLDASADTTIERLQDRELVYRYEG